MQLSDGLGTKLSAAYLVHFHVIDRTHATSLTPALDRLVTFALAMTGGHSGEAKLFFGNGTTDGKDHCRTRREGHLHRGAW